MTNEQKNMNPPPYTHVRSILSWVLAVFLFVIGIGLLTANVLVGLLMIAVAASFVPALKTKLRQRVKRLGMVQGASIFILLIAAVAVMPSPPVTEDPIADVPVVEETATDGSLQDEQVSDPDVVSGGDVPTEQEEVVITEDVKERDTEVDTNDTDTEPAPAQEETVSQRNALRQAKSYLAYTAFSYPGLISQLEYEGYSNADATYGADNSGVDWYEQAAKKAQDYLNYTAFSRGGLISQLEYDGFTQSQAEYGADAVGL